jgi:hypothetical protein
LVRWRAWFQPQGDQLYTAWAKDHPWRAAALEAAWLAVGAIAVNGGLWVVSALTAVRPPTIREVVVTTLGFFAPSILNLFVRLVIHKRRARRRAREPIKPTPASWR